MADSQVRWGVGALGGTVTEPGVAAALPNLRPREGIPVQS